MGKFVIKQIKNGQYYFNLKASNGQTIISSEGYTSKAGCLNGIHAVKLNSTDDNKYKKLVSSNGKNFFNLKSSNGAIVGTSQMYSSKNSMELGIKAVKEIARGAPIEN